MDSLIGVIVLKVLGAAMMFTGVVLFRRVKNWQKCRWRDRKPRQRIRMLRASLVSIVGWALFSSGPYFYANGLKHVTAGGIGQAAFVAHVALVAFWSGTLVVLGFQWHRALAEAAAESD